MQMPTQMKNALRRLRVLERLPHLQPPPSPFEQIEDRALRQISDEDLEVMIKMTRDLEAGVRQTISERESAMLVAHNAARETEARRMGFRSFAQAKRRAG
jgi:hypothetical protein